MLPARETGTLPEAFENAFHDCILYVLRSLHSVHDEEKPFELELSWVCEETGNEFRRVPAGLAESANAAAKAALADSDMCAWPVVLLTLACEPVLCCKSFNGAWHGCSLSLLSWQCRED